MVFKSSSKEQFKPKLIELSHTIFQNDTQ